ncbi:MAG: hypothetical protein IJ173_08090 [Kiritimatiellae bacterium]|nr:hypothetical protein [Kiritimatiellia bacterium]
MALDINGYNATFKAFTDFATQSVEAGDTKAIARAGEGGPLAGRTITAAKGDFIGNVGRFSANRDANNVARDLFKQAIEDMFGGPEKIPPSVQDAMKLEDFGKGKPLTARRILAVKNAIDASGVLQQKAFEASISTFKDQAGMAKIALEKGYTKSELPKLAVATNLYAKATGCSEAEALEAVSTPNSKANRLMNYGGRFLQSADNFKEGLRLMDSFQEWFTQVRETKNAGGEATSLTGLNIAQSVTTHDATAAFERFVFDELAVNGSLDLKETDPEKIFGVKNNAAMRFFAGNRCLNFVGVLANMPPERRGAVYQVFDKLSLPLAETKNEALSREGMSAAERGVDNPHLVIGRILRHLPEIERLAAKGALTEKNIVKTLFPDVQPRSWTRAAMNQFTHHIDTLATDVFMADAEDEAEAQVAGMKIQLIMEETCCTFQEAIEAYKKGRRVAPPQYMTTATFSIEKLDGTTNAARKQLDGNKMGDLWRPYNYAPADDPGNTSKFFIKDSANVAFGFTFPDGTSLKANAAEHAGNIPTILDKLESLAGKVHPRQQSAVMFAVSQAGVGVLKGGLTGLGVHASEHAAVDFTISKSDVTGDITIRYSSPKELPFSFEWSATIKPDGFVSTTPLRFLDEQPTANCRAGVEEAVKNMQNPRGTHNQFFEKDKARAVPLIETMMHATGGDKDVINLLKDTYVCTSLLYNSANNLRPADVILSRVARLKENVAELREATKGNPAMFKMGLSRLAGLGGKPVPKGMLASLVKAVNAADIGKLRKLSAASTTPVKMNAAIVQYHAAVGQAIKKSGILAMFDGDVGGEEMLGMNMLAGGLVAGRLGQDALRSIKGALESPVAGQLQAIYTDLNNENLVDAGVPRHEATIMKRTVSDLSSDILSLLDNVNATLGVEGGNVPAFRGSLDDLDGFDDIAIEIRDMTNKVHADLIQMEREEIEARDMQRMAGANGMQGGNLVIEP